MKTREAITHGLTRDTSGPVYIVFDKQSGRLLRAHSRFSAAANATVEIPIEELQAMFRADRSLVSAVAEQNPDNLGVIRASAKDFEVSVAYKVDVVRQAIVPLPRLSLTADRLMLKGDGIDRVEIGIEALATSGRLATDFSGRIKVTTTRGHLSAPGGVVDVSGGTAKIILTSVRETVSRVQVMAIALDGLCARGHIAFEFL